MKFGVDIDAKLTYDANGNIKAMVQNGLVINNSPVIDHLTYTYNTNSNKLLKVEDTATTNYKLGDFQDGSSGTGNDYSYDANGNLTSDANKDISSITYNYLNLPSVTTVTGTGTMTFTYDAAGNKLKKVTVDNTTTPAKTTTTLYVGGAVYENDTLQLMAHEEGRIRPVKDANNNITGFVYDYFLKDHLGNIRMVLTEQKDTSFYPPASMETAQATTEEALYANINATRVSKPTGYPTDNYTNPNDEVAKTNEKFETIGPAIILKVMAGDKFNIRVSSWYKKNGATPNSPNSIATDLVTDLISSLTGSGGPVHGTVTSTQLNNSGVIPTAANSFLSNQPAPGSTKPKAYINWVLLDEQFKFVQSSSGAEQVGDDNTFTVHTKTDMPIDKNGYLYVFLSNETPNISVYWDNLQITHIHGPILEETHYYPFGLTMAGISSKAANVLENRYKANGGTEYSSKEFTDGSGLDWYDTDFRRYNAQIGRFTGIDALCAFAPDQSSYSFVQNNPISFIDPLGLDTVRVNGEGSHSIKIGQGDVLAWTIGETTSYYTYDPNNADAVGGFVGDGIDGGTLPEVTVTAQAKPKEDAGGSNLKDRISWGIDAGLSITETSRATFRLTNGAYNGNTFSPRWYSPSPVTGRGWNGGSTARIKTFKVSGVAKSASYGLFWVGVVTDGIGVYKYYTAPNTDPNALLQPVHPAKAGLNTAVGYFSLKVNPVAGALYFGVDAFYPGGWQGAATDYDRIQRANAAVVPGFITAPYGALKQ